MAFTKEGAGKPLDTMNMNDPIIAFLFGQKGLMAGATIEGAKFTKLAREAIGKRASAAVNISALPFQISFAF